MAGMSFDEYWVGLVQKTPQLADEERKLTLTVAALKKALRNAYAKGALSSKPNPSKAELEKAAEDFAGVGRPKVKPDFDNLKDFFGGMWG